MKKLFAQAIVLISALSTSAFATPAMTRFDPLVHGFHFGNTFSNDFVPALDIRTGGLCGGMAWASLDYFFAGKPIPKQDYRPANRTPLQSYLYNRQVDSITTNLDKWTELGFNPGGARNSEFFNWGLQAGPGGRITELKAKIDAGIPVPIGLQEAGEASHQVVAIGYDLGRYRGDLGNFKEDFKIFVYDNNHPNRIKTLIPDVANQVYKYPDSRETWRAYFVQTKYSAARSMPIIPNPTYPNDGKIYELLVNFQTGNDDLRGGNDNVNLALKLKSGEVQNFSNVNLSGRWLNNYEETVRVVLPRAVSPADLDKLTISTTFRGGIDGDNWDMKRVTVRAFGGNVDKIIKMHGFKRFTGDSKSLELSVAQGPSVPAGFVNKLYLYVKTGGDDLRGGNDNYNVTVFFAGGSSRVFTNVNGSGRYPDWSEFGEDLVLSRNVKPEQITRVEIQTTFGGGMGGDNWNMEKLEIWANGPDVNVKIGESGPKRFTGDDKKLTINTRPMP